MADFDTFEFVIPGYTPETIPLDRLLEYLQQVSAMLGDSENIHLVDVRKGSVAPVFKAPKAAALKAQERVARIRRGEGTKRQTDAYKRTGQMLRRDNPGKTRSEQRAFIRTPKKVILEIEAAPDDSGVLEGVRQFTTIDGELIRIGGAGENPTLQMVDLQGNILSGFTAKRDMVKELAPLIYQAIRLHGIGVWCRSSEGVWSIDRMQVQSYERLEDESLSMVIERLQDIDVSWPDDALTRLANERERA